MRVILRVEVVGEVVDVRKGEQESDLLLLLLQGVTPHQDQLPTTTREEAGVVSICLCSHNLEGAI